MPSNKSFTVALVLTAVNSMSSVMNQSKDNLRQYSNQVRQTAGEVSRYNQQMQNLQSSMEKYHQIRDSGARDIQAGAMMLVPVEETLRHAANFQGAMKKVENALYDSSIPLQKQKEMLAELEKQSEKLGTVTTFNNLEAAQAQLMLFRNGMEYKDVLEGGATAAMYLAQTAETAPMAAADAVSEITNMFQLQGNQLLQVADDVNRAANASSAGVENIMHDLQQTGMSAHTLGLEVKETTLLLGTLHNMGLGDASGTYLNDMLINLDKVTPKARKALQSMGWLEGATVKTLKSGNVKISGGTNSLFDENGQIRSAELMVQKLRQVLYNNSGLKPEEMRDKKGNLLPQEEIERLLQAKNKLEALQNLKDVFGIQGMRAAIGLATPGKGSYEEMVEKAERAKSIQDQVLEWQDTLLGRVETLKGSWETLMTQTGSPLTNEVGGIVKDITNLMNSLGKWANANPQLAAGIIRIVGYMAAGRIIFGGLKFMLGGTGVAINGIAGFLLKAGGSAKGFYDAFKYFRQGAGIFRSLWSAVAFGNPTMARIISTVGRFGGRLLWLGTQGLVMGAKLAWGWIIGLGPVGWVIGGVTLAVIAGIAAWKTNFGGFRDFVLGVVETVVRAINRVRSFLGMSLIELDFMKKGAGDFKMAEYEKPPVVKGGGMANDNRQYNINIKSTDPKQAAAEVSKVTGGMDKYQMSRDPRLGDPAFSM
ncbi:phage tail length tape-measure protein [Desulfocucumis palustris]|uniref:Phage tail length tape-measure protein n=1 Tax=Desulfocucumis palustris TaxID=1898651 RepID=A0A2L2XCT1_9FIRM|nr:phage tail tape measure protein [Desulfocucumis palustris]GBF34147.1 phage tail length tape-measure protein [Desulfocucumis palustris]